MEVKEAEDNDELRPGLALVAPGDFHMLLREGGRPLLRERQDRSAGLLPAALGGRALHQRRRSRGGGRGGSAV